MKITYDPAKDASNLEKHGISLGDASCLDWNNALIWEDARHDYGEIRHVALAILGQRVHAVVFVERLDGRRIISLRRANVNEVMRYVHAIENED